MYGCFRKEFHVNLFQELKGLTEWNPPIQGSLSVLRVPLKVPYRDQTSDIIHFVPVLSRI